MVMLVRETGVQKKKKVKKVSGVYTVFQFSYLQIFQVTYFTIIIFKIIHFNNVEQ